jgi:hypothetical protein
MKRLTGYWHQNARLIMLGVLVAAGLGWLLLHKLASLTGGLSGGEVSAATAAVGWHGIYADPLYLPLKLVRSVVFFLAPDHGQALTRLPNVVFGGLTTLTFGWLIWLWHGQRTALLTTLLFGCSAWVLHVSRLASFDVLYLWSVPTLLMVQVLLHRYRQKAAVWYACLIAWSALLYIPGLVWLVLLQVYLQRKLIADGWRHLASWRLKLLSLASGLLWLPLLGVDLSRHGRFLTWLGLPSHWPGLGTLLKQFVAVPIHLFVRGPQYPDIWLARAPIMDIFTLVVCGLGIYFYAVHWRSSRTRSLANLFLAGWILVAIGGPVGLSLLVPFLYVMAATGLAYLLRDWLKVFPLNPLARGIAVGLVSLAVIASCVFQLRAYFVVWPHTATTHAVFRYHR